MHVKRWVTIPSLISAICIVLIVNKNEPFPWCWRPYSFEETSFFGSLACFPVLDGVSFGDADTGDGWWSWAPNSSRRITDGLRSPPLNSVSKCTESTRVDEYKTIYMARAREFKFIPSKFTNYGLFLCWLPVLISLSVLISTYQPYSLHQYQQTIQTNRVANFMTHNLSSETCPMCNVISTDFDDNHRLIVSVAYHRGERRHGCYLVHSMRCRRSHHNLIVLLP